jgi:hypothetical protein
LQTHSSCAAQGVQLSVSPLPRHFLAAHGLESLRQMDKRTAANHTALSSTETKPKRRKGGKKSSNGCRTCVQRRVRCDENMPRWSVYSPPLMKCCGLWSHSEDCIRRNVYCEPATKSASYRLPAAHQVLDWSPPSTWEPYGTKVLSGDAVPEPKHAPIHDVSKTPS